MTERKTTIDAKTATWRSFAKEYGIESMLAGHPIAKAVEKAEQDDVLYKIMALECEIEHLVETIACGSKGAGDMQSLAEVTAANWPKLWAKHGGITPETSDQAESKAMKTAMDKMK